MWNDLGGLDWQGLPAVAALHGCDDDMGMLIAILATLRDAQRAKAREGNDDGHA